MLNERYLLLKALVIGFILIQSCKMEKSNKTKNVKDTLKSQTEIAFETINKQLNTTENCYIFDSTNVFKTIEDFLEMERFDGKVVYIDFWGTRCKPCLEEFEFTPFLKKKFQDEAIEYLYICFYSSPKGMNYKEMLWKMIIKKYKIKGINLLVSKDLKYHFYDKYRDKTDPSRMYLLPTYLLINKQGEVVDFNAPRPSSKEVLYEKIQELLDE